MRSAAASDFVVRSPALVAELLQVLSVARTRHSLHLRDPPVEQRAFSLQRRSSADPERVDHTAVFSRALRVIQGASVPSAVPCG